MTAVLSGLRTSVDFMPNANTTVNLFSKLAFFDSEANTTFNNYKLLNSTFHCDLRKYFTACVVKKILVVKADTVSSFKARLDKLIEKFDFSADLIGTGDQ